MKSSQPKKAKEDRSRGWRVGVVSSSVQIVCNGPGYNGVNVSIIACLAYHKIRGMHL